MYCGVFILDLPYLNCSKCSIIHGWGLGLPWFSCCWNLLEQSTAQPRLLPGLLLCIWNLSLEYSSHQRVLLALRSFSVWNGNKVLPRCLINLIVRESAPIPAAFHSIQKSSWVSSACCIAWILCGTQGFVKQSSLRCLFQMFGVFCLWVPL